jgi:tetratricopeptide (TPR) repeat protein
LQKDLNGNGYDAWLDKQRIEGGASWTNSIEEAIDNADYLLALLTQGSYVSEICRAEQLRSLRKGKCVIPLKAQSNTDVPLHLEAKNYRDFSAGSNYAQAFNELLGDLHNRKGVPLREEFRQTYVTAPPLPVNFVERPDAAAALRDAVMTDDGGRHVALTALHGMGGIGKTVLAQALCRDEVVQDAFPDGVIWVTVGKESQFDALTRMREVGRALNDDLSLYDNLLAAKDRFRTTIRKKAALIVVDDVWRSTDLEPLLAENSPRSRLLFTTRDAGISAAVGAREHLAELLSEQKAREVLARWAGTEADKLPAIAGDLIKECGRLPLALSMVGAMVRGKPPALWKRVLELLRNADLAKIKAQFPDYPYTDVLRALQVSVDSLDQTARKRYLALAVLLEEMAAAPQVQQCIWGVDEGEAVETAEQLISLSLAQRGESEGSIKLHDLQLDYVRGIAREYLPDIHSQLVRNYQLRYPGGWHKGPNDGHYFENLAYHLASAERFPEAKEILTDQDFIYAKFANRTSFFSDFRISEHQKVKCTNDMATAMIAVCEHEGPEGFWGQFRAALSQQFGHYIQWPTAARNSLRTSRNFGAQLFIATTLGMAGMRTEAIKVFKAILRMGFSQEDYWKASIRLSVIYQETGRAEQALRILNKLVRQPGAIKLFEHDYWWAQYQIGKNLLSQGKLNRAKDILESVRREAREGSRKTAALHQLGVIDLESRLFDEAERKFKKCLDERPDTTTNHRRAFEYRRLGDVYALTRRLTEAEVAFGKALDISKRCGDWRYVEEIGQVRAKFRVVAYLRTHKPMSVNLMGLCSKLEIKNRGMSEAFAILGATREGYLEVIDETTAQPTGDAARWEVIHSVGLWHASVAVLVADDRGRVALQRRGESDSYGKWDISAAGHVDVGESDVHAAVREVREELQLEIDATELARMGTPYQYRKTGGPEVKCDKHESATSYTYWRRNRNRERISLFVVKVSERSKPQIRSSGVGAALSVEWKTPLQVCRLATSHPGQCASSLKQFFTSNKSISLIEMAIHDARGI